MQRQTIHKKNLKLYMNFVRIKKKLWLMHHLEQNSLKYKNAFSFTFNLLINASYFQSLKTELKKHKCL